MIRLDEGLFTWGCFNPEKKYNFNGFLLISAEATIVVDPPPCKSPGEIGLYWEKRGVLVLGDALIAPYGALKLIPESKLDDPARLKDSLRKLDSLEFDILLLADGDPILRDAKPKVMDFLKTL